MSIFRHEKTKKCLSFGDLSYLYNGNPLKLEKCSEYDADFDKSKLPDTKVGKYNIMGHDPKNGNLRCLGPSEDGETLELSTKCDENTIFEILHDTETAPNEDTIKNKIKHASIKTLITFSDNRNAKIINKNVLWSKSLTNARHELSHANYKTYFTLYQFKEDSDIDNLYNSNGDVSCKLKMHIDEYEQDPDVVLKKTTYFLVPNQNETAIIFSNVDTPKDIRLIISTFSVKKGNETQNDENINVSNFHKVKIGYKTSNGMVKYAKIDQYNNDNGMTLASSTNCTLFRLSLLENADKFKVLYRGYNENSDNIKLASYINPTKKMSIKRNGQLHARNSRDNDRSRSLSFQVRPVVEGMTTLNKGMTFNEIREGMVSGVGSQNNTNQTSYEDIVNGIRVVAIKYKMGKETISVMIQDIDTLTDNITKSSFQNDRYHSQPLLKLLASLRLFLLNVETAYTSCKTMREHMVNFLKSYNSAKGLYQVINNRTVSDSIDTIVRIITQKIKEVEQTFTNLKAYKRDVEHHDVLNLQLFENNEGIELPIHVLRYEVKIIRTLAQIGDKIDGRINAVYSVFGNPNEVTTILPTLKQPFIVIKPPSPSDIQELTEVITIIKDLKKEQSTLRGKRSNYLDVEFGDILDACFSNSGSILTFNTRNIFNIENRGLITNIETCCTLQIRNVKLSMDCSTCKSDITSTFSNIIRTSPPGNTITSLEIFFTTVMRHMTAIVQRLNEFKSSYPNAINVNDMVLFNHINIFNSNYETYKSADQVPLLFVNIYRSLAGSNSKVSLRSVNDLSDFYTPSFFLSYLHVKLYAIFIPTFSGVVKHSMSIIEGGSSLSKPLNANLNSDDANMIEGFTGSVSSVNNTFYPNIPKPLNICKIESDTNDFLKMGLVYKKADAENYSSLEKAYESLYDEINGYKCKSIGGNYVNIDMAVKYNNISESIPVAYGSKISQNSSVCSSNNNECDFNAMIMLKHDTDNKQAQLYIKHNKDNVDLILTNPGSLPNDDDMDIVFDPETINVSNIKTRFYITNDRIDMLTKRQDKTNQLLGNHALYSMDGKLRLVINDSGKLELHYKIKPNKSIDNTNYGNIKYSVTTNDVYINKVPNADDNMKYQVGNTINKLGFVNIDNTFKAFGVDHPNVIKSSEVYKQYPNLTLNRNKGEPISSNPCETDADCLGYYDDGTNKYKITNDNKNYISLGNSGTVYLKQYGLKISDGNNNFLLPPSNNNLVGHDVFNIYKGKRGNDISTGLLKHVLNEKTNEMNQMHEDLKVKLSNFVDIFNSLSKDEMEMVKSAGISVENVKELIQKYDTVYSNGQRSRQVNTLVNAQLEDINHSKYHKSQYMMAMAGVASLSGLLYLMNVLK
jgi:hypothetical protein